MFAVSRHSLIKRVEQIFIEKNSIYLFQAGFDNRQTCVGSSISITIFLAEIYSMFGSPYKIVPRSSHPQIKGIIRIKGPEHFSGYVKTIHVASSRKKLGNFGRYLNNMLVAVINRRQLWSGIDWKEVHWFLSRVSQTPNQSCKRELHHFCRR